MAPAKAPEELEARLGLAFRDRRLLEQALVHPSYLNENPGFPLGSNERLEFLGDAVIGLVVGLELFQRQPHLSEGELTKLRSYLVRGETLARVAGGLKLGLYLALGRGEEATGGRRRRSNLAAALEALVGAIFLDQGYEVARGFVLRAMDGEIAEVLREGVPQDAKSRLQEVLQRMGNPPPHYLSLIHI